MSAIISQSADGEIIARVVEILGWYPVRGSSSRGGKAALEKVKKLAKRGYNIGHAVDGPTGPFGVIKPGLLRIAQAGDMPVMPAIMSGEKKWVFNSWDKFMIPKPFSRVIIRFGDGIDISPDLTARDFENQCKRVERIMKALYEDTDRIWDDPERIKQIFH